MIDKVRVVKRETSKTSICGESTGNRLDDIAIMNRFGTSSTGDGVGLVYQNADGSFASANYTAISNIQLKGDISIGDVNGDKLNDIVITRSYDGPGTAYKLQVYTQGTGGVFTLKEYDTKYMTYTIKIYDFDNDNKNDILLSDIDNGCISVFYQKSDGTLDTEVTYDINQLSVSSKCSRDALALGDFDCDGRADDVVLLSETNPVLFIKSK